MSHRHSLLRSGLVASLALALPAATYSWQEIPATIDATGDLHWAPTSYQHTVGSQVRYIDYEGGNDNNDGTSTSSAWKHHPWDHNATANAAACSGPITYIFKR
ncbi:MAG: hypothetical protein ACOCXA_08645, partial [Planctomycetota bacterium]